MAAARGNFTVHVKGYREVNRALKAVDDGAGKAVLDGLKEAANPIAGDANRRLARFQGVGQVVSRATRSGVFIRQSKRKRTGKRPDFGALQMRDGLIPAAEAGERDLVSRVDDALGRLIAKERLS